MSSNPLAISVRGVTKAYALARQSKATTLGEAMMRRIRRPFAGAAAETFWALDGVNFDVRQGEVVGIIGRNGAGKSTLLKILSRITGPTAGKIELYGRVGSLLEVGTGFHPELTGRENIYLNGGILGMRRKEIDRQFDAIVAFAEVEKFLDTPVKRYSSGMYVRLAFAVAAHLNPEILIVDEVLAVGDAAFQKKCLGKMGEVAQQEGRTVLFVSHNMAAVQALCTRGILLERGKVSFDGDATEATARYLSPPRGADDQPAGEFDLTDRVNLHLTGRLLMRRATIRDLDGQPTDTLPMGQGLSLTIDVEGLSDFSNFLLGAKLKTDSDLTLANISTRMKPPPDPGRRSRREQIVLNIPHLQLTPGTYWIDLLIKQRAAGWLDQVERACRFEVVEADVFGTGFQFHPTDGLMFIDPDWEIIPSAADVTETAATIV